MNDKKSESTSKGPEEALRDMLSKLEDAARDAGDRMSDFWDDVDIKRRLSDAVDALDDVRLEVTRRISGKPATTPLEEMTVKELHELATKRGIEGRSSMNKAELVDALRKDT